MKLNGYNALAYEFAIRNPRVIELLSQPLTDNSVKELRRFGINAISEYFDNPKGDMVINSTRELYLDYHHLKGIGHHPYSPYGHGRWYDNETHEEHDEYRGDNVLVHPLSSEVFVSKEPDEDAIPRIEALIETRGNKLKRLADGTAFYSFDAITFFSQSVYSLDESGNRSKTIRSDIKFITEWIKPENYLQLLPSYIPHF